MKKEIKNMSFKELEQESEETKTSLERIFDRDIRRKMINEEMSKRVKQEIKK